LLFKASLGKVRVTAAALSWASATAKNKKEKLTMIKTQKHLMAVKNGLECSKRKDAYKFFI
jgi:hypothetical protein